MVPAFVFSSASLRRTLQVSINTHLNKTTETQRHSVTQRPLWFSLSLWLCGSKKYGGLCLLLLKNIPIVNAARKTFRKCQLVAFHLVIKFAIEDKCPIKIGSKEARVCSVYHISNYGKCACANCRVIISIRTPGKCIVRQRKRNLRWSIPHIGGTPDKCSFVNTVSQQRRILFFFTCC